MILHYIRQIFRIKTNRYFIIFYTANDIKGYLRGQSSFALNDVNPFLNHHKILNWLKNDLPTASNFVISNFIELNKYEYYKWNSK